MVKIRFIIIKKIKINFFLLHLVEFLPIGDNEFL